MKPDTSHPELKLSSEDEMLVLKGCEIAPRQDWQRAASWRAIRDRITRRERWRRVAAQQLRTWAGLALGGATAVVFLWIASTRLHNRVSGQASGTTAQRSEAWRDVALGSVGHLSVAPGARLRLPTPEPGPDDPYRVTLDEGQLCAQVNHRDPVRQGPFQVDAQGLRIVDLGTRFCVVAGNGPSWVSVEEGSVQVHGEAPEPVIVSGGESLSADDPRLASLPPAPSVVDPDPSNTATPHRPARRPTGLSIENSRYEAGMRARDAHNGREALAIWEDYRRRFPQGVFSAEVDLLRLRELASEGKTALVLEASEEFSRAHPGHWRGAEADLIRADALRVQLARPSEALPLYQRVLAVERQASL